MQTTIQKITPFLWFDNQAEEAVNFYLTILGRSSGRMSDAALSRRRRKR